MRTLGKLSTSSIRSWKDLGYYMATGGCKINAWRMEINAKKKEDARLIIRAKGLNRGKYWDQGPNCIWHIDSYEVKVLWNLHIWLHRWLFIWLKVSHTSSDPHVIGGWFVEAVEQTGGCPWIIRMDLGTEIVVIRDIHIFLRRHDIEKRCVDLSYIAGTSRPTSNKWI